MMYQTHKHKYSNCGFTLVEVLAAVTVLVIVLPSIMYGISLATGVASLAKQRAQATALAECKLHELVLNGDSQVGSLSGEFGDDGPGFQWQAALSDWDDPNLQQLQVTVGWTTRNTPHEVVLSTLIYNGSSGALGQ